MRRFPLLLSIIFLFLNCSDKEIIEMRLSVILSSSEETINLALTELKEGSSFTEVVKNYSTGPNKENGGDIGFLKKDDLRKVLQDEAVKLEMGAYSGIISSANEYYILMKTDERIVRIPFERQKFLLIGILAIVSFLLASGSARAIKYHIKSPRFSISMPDGSHLTVYSDEELSEETVGQRDLQGARIVVFEYCISLIFVTFKRTSFGYLIQPHQGTFTKALPYILISLFLGWWGFPWGPIYTISSIFKNLFGGIDVGLV